MQFNPDPLRKDKELLTVNEVKKLFAENHAFFLKSIFNPEEDIDFNGVFIKMNKKNSRRRIIISGS